MSSDSVSEWAQGTLLPPAVVEVTLKVGIIYASDHVQMELEVRSPTDGTLLGLQSVPHRALSSWEPELKRLMRDLLEEVTARTAPFI